MKTKPKQSSPLIPFVLSLVAVIAIPAPAWPRKKQDEPKPTARAKSESPACADCCKKASLLFADGKTIDAMKLLNANQSICRDSLKFNLLYSTILLRVPGNAKAAAQAATNAVELEPTSVPARMQQGICLMAAEDKEGAAEAFENLIKIDPSNYEAWSALGTLYGELHDQAKAKACQYKAAGLEPGTRTSRIRAAQNLFKAGKPEAVAAELQKIITDDHLEPEFFIALARDALEMHAYNESIQAANKALAAYPKVSDLIKTKAKAQLWKREYTEGLETIGKLDAQAKDEVEAVAIKSLLLIKLGRTKEAQALVGKLPANTTEAPLAGLARAYMAERNGQPGEAILQCESSLRHNQLFAPAHIELARIYLRQGRAEDVVFEAREIQRLKPYVSSARAMESRLALEEAPAREKVQEALKLAREAVKLNGEDPEALTALALSELKGGKLDTARELTNKALEIEPGNIDASLASIKVLEGEGKGDKRLEALKNLNAMAKGDSEVLSALSQAYQETGDLSSAIKVLKDQVADVRPDPVIVFSLARAYERSGRPKEAAKYFKLSLTEGLKGPRANLARDALKNIGNQPEEM